MLTVNCETCDKLFHITPARLKNKHHTCSVKCRAKLSSLFYSQKIEKQCEYCNKIIFYKKSKIKTIKHYTCSKECRYFLVKKLGLYKNNLNPTYKNFNELERYFHEKLMDCKRRACINNLPFNIDMPYLLDLYLKQNKLCAYTKHPMKLKSDKLKSNGIDYNVLSIDKIIPNVGYTKGNVALCMNCINMLKSNYTQKEMEKVFMALKNTESNTFLKVKKLNENAIIPTRNNPDDSGLDLYAIEDTAFNPLETKIVKTGIAFGIPAGHEIQVRPRSGMSLKTSMRVSNSPGTVDKSYIGECCVIMTNTSPNSPFLVRRGDRIAQAVLAPITIPILTEVSSLDETERGDKGFGASGD